MWDNIAETTDNKAAGVKKKKDDIKESISAQLQETKENISESIQGTKDEIAGWVQDMKDGFSTALEQADWHNTTQEGKEDEQ